MRTLTRCCLLILHSILRTDYLDHYRETRDQMHRVGNKEVLRPRCMLWCFWIGNCEEDSSNDYMTDLELASTQSAAFPGGGVIARFKLSGHPNRQ